MLTKCKSLARVAKTRELGHQPLHADFCDYVPSRDTCDQLVKAYLRTFESVYRIVHIPSFQEEYSQYWSNPRSASHDFVIKLLLMLAIGMAFSPAEVESTRFRSSSSQWIYTAQSWLNSPFQKSRINISGLQIYCLLLLARQVNAIGGDLIWISASSLLSTAMHMGLHIDPSHFPQMSFFDAEMRRRLWASVLEITVQSSMDAGGLPLITSQDFDCKPPSNINDMQIQEGLQGATPAAPMKEFTETSIQLALIRSLPIRLKVARIMNDFRSDSSYDQTLRLGAILSSLCREDSKLFQSLITCQPKPSTFQMGLFNLMTHRFLLALHIPYAMKARINPSFYYSRKVCLEISLSLLSHPFKSGEPLSPDDDYERQRLIGNGMLRDVPLQAAGTICGELLNQLEEDKESFMPSVFSSSRLELRDVIEDYVNLTASRIKYGETNVKGHVMFSCLLAQFDAMQSGSSLDQAISNALKKSLDTCYRLLRDRAEGSATNATATIESSLDTEQIDVTALDVTDDWFLDDSLVSLIFSPASVSFQDLSNKGCSLSRLTTQQWIWTHGCRRI
jgi:Fungal specific transcription factor domain